MPVMDGYEAVQNIRKIESQKKVNKAIIIAVTAFASSEVRKNILSVGMNAIYPKPIKQKLVAQLVNDLKLDYLNQAGLLM